MEEIDENDGREIAVKGEKKGLTRRSFLGSAAVGAAAVGVSGGLFGVPAALAGTLTEDAENIVWDRETDVLVIGTGYAGLCAAIEAKDAGADVLILEKNTFGGGNSMLSGGAAQFGGTSIQAAQGIVDSPALMFKEVFAYGDHRAEQDLLRAVVADSASTVEWLQGLGLTFKKTTSFQEGMSVARTHTPDVSPTGKYEATNGAAYYQVMYQALVARGVTTLLQHKAVKLIQAGEDGPIVGVEVQDIAGGKTLNIRTRRSVFLGSGGFKSNIAMRVVQDPRLDEDFSAGGLPYVETTGEMIMAAVDAGADLTGMAFVCEFRFKWGTKIYQLWDGNTNHRTGGAGLTANFDKSICVNNDGQRFVDEYTSTLLSGQPFAEAYASLEKPRQCWNVLDSASVTAAWQTALASPNPAVSPCVSADMIYSADTLAALAAKMGVNAANFQAEVAKYNGYVDSGVDSDFDRPADHMKTKIATAPFYACKAQFFAHDQMSGLTVNVPGQVIKRSEHIGPTPIPIDQQEVIPRLYAGGECCGGYYGKNRGHGKIGLIMNISRRVGRSAAAETPLGAAVTSLSAKADRAALKRGQTVSLSGVLSGSGGVPAGALVSLQVRAPGKGTFATVPGEMTLDAARTVAKSYKLLKQGTYYFRMQFAGTPSFAPCTSADAKVVSR
jgi:flavocytochrome c